MVGALLEIERERFVSLPCRSSRRTELLRVIEQIDALCGAYGVGARIPSLRDLMVRFQASERTVMSALNELQRKGRIVRRAGSGTYVATPHRLIGDFGVNGYGTSRDTSCSSIVLVAAHDNAFFSRGVDLVYKKATQLGLDVSYEAPRADRIASICGQKDGARRGFIVLGSNNYDLCMRIHEAGERVVYVGGKNPDTDVVFPCVCSDDYFGAYVAAEHLIKLGHRRLANVLPISPERSRGHRDAVLDARASGRDITTCYVGEDQWIEWRTRPELAAEYFSLPKHPTGLCAWNDHNCVALLTILMSLHIMVPDQISLVGYDGGWEARNVSPALTTIDNKLEDRIDIALSLLESPKSGAPCFSAVVKPDLVVRASTAPCKYRIEDV